MVKDGNKLAKVALGKVLQSLPSTDASLTALGNRVAELEGANLITRVAELEEIVSALLTHTHNYDDGGVPKITGTPNP